MGFPARQSTCAPALLLWPFRGARLLLTHTPRRRCVGTGLTGLLPSTRTSGAGTPLGWRLCGRCTSLCCYQHRDGVHPISSMPRRRVHLQSFSWRASTFSPPPHSPGMFGLAQVPTDFVFQPKYCRVGCGARPWVDQSSGIELFCWRVVNYFSCQSLALFGCPAVADAGWDSVPMRRRAHEVVVRG